MNSVTCALSTDDMSILSSTATDDTYMIGDASGSQVFLDFSLSSASCQQSDIIYSMIVTPTTSSQSTAFISFNSLTRIVSWLSSTAADVGEFTIDVLGSITNAYETETATA
jgi:hypothetical protein